MHSKLNTKRTVYLIHFATPYKHVRHYLGSTDDLEARIERHRAGNGARLMEVITGAGIGWTVVRTWEGGRKLERRLKNWKHAAQFCPACSGEKASKRAVFERKVK